VLSLLKALPALAWILEQGELCGACCRVRL